MFNRIYARMMMLDYRLLLVVGLAVALMALTIANYALWLSHGTLIASGPVPDSIIKPDANWNS